MNNNTRLPEASGERGAMSTITCPSNKKVFSSEQLAVAFEENNRRSYGGVQQYAYACEECPNWHLTATPPGVATMAATHLTGTALPSDVSGEELTRLRDAGTSVKDLVLRFGIPEHIVYKRIAKYRVDSGQTKPTVRRQAVTLDQVSEERLKIQEQMAEMQRKLEEAQRTELRLLEDQKLKFEVVGEGVIIRKKHEQITITLAELNDLYEKVYGG